MKRIGFATLLIVITCGSIFVVFAQKRTVNTQKSKSSKEVVESMFAAFNRHDVEGMAALYSEDAFIDSPELATPKRGRQGVREIYSKYFKDMPDIRDEVKNMVVCGNKVFVEFVATGTIPSTQDATSTGGKKFSLKIATALEVRGGRIIRDVTYYDRLAASN